MKILYIDNRQYGHNADIHINFIKHLSKIHKVIGYGMHLSKYLENSHIPRFDQVKKDFNTLLNKVKPDVILTYNCNGSSYEVKLDNISIYKWIEDSLARIDLPKFHITTDYCRSGFVPAQAKWFKDLRYSASLFRHKVALEYPSKVDTYWLPFSVDKALYTENINKDISSKLEKVGFLGAAHDSAKSLYVHRISAIDFLNKHNMIQLSEVTDHKKFKRKLFFGREYVRFLTQNLFSLTCGGTCNFFTAKYFQIPASYSMLICTDTVGLEDFPPETYITYHKDDLDLMMSKIEHFISHKKEAAEKIDTLHRHVIQNHNHDIRVEQLISIMKKYK